MRFLYALVLLATCWILILFVSDTQCQRGGPASSGSGGSQGGAGGSSASSSSNSGSSAGSPSPAAAVPSPSSAGPSSGSGPSVAPSQPSVSSNAAQSSASDASSSKSDSASAAAAASAPSRSISRDQPSNVRVKPDASAESSDRAIAKPASASGGNIRVKDESQQAPKREPEEQSQTPPKPNTRDENRRKPVEKADQSDGKTIGKTKEPKGSGSDVTPAPEAKRPNNVRTREPPGGVTTAPPPPLTTPLPAEPAKGGKRVRDRDRNQLQGPPIIQYIYAPIAIAAPNCPNAFCGGPAASACPSGCRCKVPLDRLLNDPKAPRSTCTTDYQAG